MKVARMVIDNCSNLHSEFVVALHLIMQILQIPWIRMITISATEFQIPLRFLPFVITRENETEQVWRLV